LKLTIFGSLHSEYKTNSSVYMFVVYGHVSCIYIRSMNDAPKACGFHFLSIIIHVNNELKPFLSVMICRYNGLALIKLNVGVACYGKFCCWLTNLASKCGMWNMLMM
jgi:hypothetical protein